MIISCATNDNTHFVDDHVADADYSLLFESRKNDIKVIDQIDNTAI
jgi:predicted Fe-Mo cluster-binding NifX family protein